MKIGKEIQISGLNCYEFEECVNDVTLILNCVTLIILKLLTMQFWKFIHDRSASCGNCQYSRVSFQINKQLANVFL